MVELAPLADPSLVAQAVASTLGVREQPGRSLTEMLSRYLESKKLLLVLDNCEHLIEACAELAESLLRSCPELRILAHQPRGSGHHRRSVMARSLALPSRPTASAGDGEPASVRVGPPLRGAGGGGQADLRAHGAERVGRGAGLLPAGRHPPGHRARGGEGEGVVGGADRGSTGRLLWAALRRRQDGDAPPTHPARDDGLEPRAAQSGGAYLVPQAVGIRRWFLA